jgi:phosphoribosyl-AMP cyclohydrolase
VEQAGAGACHTGRASCFYRSVPLKQADVSRLVLEFRDGEKVFDPAQVYGEKNKGPAK